MKATKVKQANLEVNEASLSFEKDDDTEILEDIMGLSGEFEEHSDDDFYNIKKLNANDQPSDLDSIPPVDNRIEMIASSESDSLIELKVRKANTIKDIRFSDLKLTAINRTNTYVDKSKHKSIRRSIPAVFKEEEYNVADYGFEGNVDLLKEVENYTTQKYAKEKAPLNKIKNMLKSVGRKNNSEYKKETIRNNYIYEHLTEEQKLTYLKEKQEAKHYRDSNEKNSPHINLQLDRTTSVVGD